MAIRNIVKHGDEVLTKKCRTVEKFDERLETLIEDLFDTLYDSGGVGLAAPQVGVLRRAVLVIETNVAEDEDEYIIYTNTNSIKAKHVILATHYPIVNFP